MSMRTTRDVPLEPGKTPRGVTVALTPYFRFYNAARPHQNLDYRTPDKLYFGIDTMRKAAER